MARRRSRRRIAITALVAVLVGAVVGLAVTGTGEPASALRLLTGDAWLDNNSDGTVSHVNGYTGGTDAQARRSASPAIPSRWCSGPAGPTCSTCAPGALSRLDDSTLGVATTTAETGRQPPCRWWRGPNTTWVLDRFVGDPAAAQSHHAGAHRSLRSPWAARPGRPPSMRPARSGCPCPARRWSTRSARRAPSPVIRFGQRRRRRSGGGHQRRGVWAVDPETATAASLQDASLHQVAAARPAARAGPPARGLDVESRPGGGRRHRGAGRRHVPAVAVLVGASRPRPRPPRWRLPPDRAYLLDPRAAQLETVDLAPLPALAPMRVPPGPTS